LAFDAPPLQSAFVSHALPAFGPSMQRFMKQLLPGQSASAVHGKPTFAPPMHLFDGQPSFTEWENVLGLPSSQGVPFGDVTGVMQSPPLTHRLRLHGSEVKLHPSVTPQMSGGLHGTPEVAPSEMQMDCASLGTDVSTPTSCTATSPIASRSAGASRNARASWASRSDASRTADAS
jgi:hypothetical protein